MIYKKIFLASALLLISGLACAQNGAGSQGTPKKDSCPTCLVKGFVGQLLDFLGQARQRELTLEARLALPQEKSRPLLGSDT